MKKEEQEQIQEEQQCQEQEQAPEEEQIREEERYVDDCDEEDYERMQNRIEGLEMENESLYDLLNSYSEEKSKYAS